MIPTEEEFEIWRDDPVTRFVLAVCRKTAGEVFDSWVQRAWASNDVDITDLLEARTRADAYLALEQSDYSDWVAKSEAPDADVPLPAKVHIMTPEQARKFVGLDSGDDADPTTGMRDSMYALLLIGMFSLCAFVSGAIIF